MKLLSDLTAAGVAVASCCVGQVPHPWGPCLCGKGVDGAHKTVVVEARTWVGINKPGGTGRITKRVVGGLMMLMIL